MKGKLIAIIVGAVIAAAVMLTFIRLSHHPSTGPSCPKGQHLVYMTPSMPGYQPGLQECVKS